MDAPTPEPFLQLPLRSQIYYAERDLEYEQRTLEWARALATITQRVHIKKFAMKIARETARAAVKAEARLKDLVEWRTVKRKEFAFDEEIAQLLDSM